ncbi:putative lipoprotein [Helicobacter pylori SouthAfrica50]|uniref:Putative lipoprotein n=1 Tax=Helicobacter pylori SouthAfrica50 TaxID=1352357 RepID=T2S7Q1_HELPX|nr:putative lipoprotein [Helicobacter pylori SouthAfrica50]
MRIKAYLLRFMAFVLIVALSFNACKNSQKISRFSKQHPPRKQP